MLETKPVKYLQSRPHHIKVIIFVFTMVTAGIALFSLWLGSLNSSFPVASSELNNNNTKITEASDKNQNLPSLLGNLKANIQDIGDSVNSFFSGGPQNDSLSADKNDRSIDVKKIKPISLPVDQQ